MCAFDERAIKWTDDNETMELPKLKKAVGTLLGSRFTFISSRAIGYILVKMILPNDLF